jgi:uncharacterized protein YcfJ
MKNIGLKLATMVMALSLMLSCNAVKNANNKQKGAVIGAGSGAAIGGILGNNVGNGNNTALGAIIGAVVGGAAGGYIGNRKHNVLNKKYLEQKLHVSGKVLMLFLMKKQGFTLTRINPK